MKFRLRFLLFATLLCALLSLPDISFAQSGQAKTDTILHAAETAKLIPSSVFFRGQSATTQTRNSGGVSFADGFYTLAALVDNSGYSTGIQEKYQAYLLTEVPLFFDGKTLSPGAYGIGIVKAETSLQFVVQDIGAHDLLQAAAANDAKLHRPTPLQVLEGSTPGKYRLYFGRDYVEFERAH